MEYVLLFLAIVVLGATVFLVVGRRRSGEPLPTQALGEPTMSLPPVLLPERMRAEDVRHVRFSLGARGYRCDQVDDVLDALSAEIERLHGELDQVRAAAGADRRQEP
ncbi:DivIVA domain-containing protein [Zhihengliuella halotolerans]|uniref:DivIVA domain-containing protein n=1 Tax=Zhihengliuella halotolerans TaxID=370736 RepID=UPI002155D93E|nr:DivIVA domain-containing protein [Zhihengliuella halotolerans]